MDHQTLSLLLHILASLSCVLLGWGIKGLYVESRRMPTIDVTRENKLAEVERLSRELVASYADGIDETARVIHLKLYDMHALSNYFFRKKIHETRKDVDERSVPK